MLKNSNIKFKFRSALLKLTAIQAFKKRSIQLFSSIFNDEMLGTLKEYFDSVDNNQTGTINTDELRRLYLTLGVRITDEELENVMEIYDKDNDGSIDFTEFILALEGETHASVMIPEFGSINVSESMTTTTTTRSNFSEIIEQTFPQFLSDSSSKDQDLVDASGLLKVCRQLDSEFSNMTIEDCNEIIRSVNASTDCLHGHSDKISKEQFLEVMQFDEKN